MIEENFLAKCATDLWTFTNFMSPIWASEQHIPLGAVHKRVCDFISQPYLKELILLPRGWRKSTLSQSFVIHEILKNPNIAVLRGSHVKTLAEDFVGELEETIEGVPFLAPMKGHPWKNDRFNVSGRVVRRKESTVMCGSPESALTGYHFNLGVIDDLIADESGRSLAAMNKATQFAKKLIPMVGETGRMRFFGTRYHRKDPYGWIISQPGYHVLRIPALNEKGESNWPEGCSTEFLYQTKKEMGPILFSLNYMLEPCPESERTFANPTYYNDNSVIADAKRYVYVDWALGVGQCLLAAIVWAKSRDGRIFIIDGWFDNTTPPMMAAIRVNELAQRNNVPTSNIYSEQLDQIRGWLGAVDSTVFSRWNRLHHRGVEKDVRIIGMAEQWNRGRVLLHSYLSKPGEPIPSLLPIVDNALDYPECEFKDPLDVLAYAVRDAVQQ